MRPNTQIMRVSILAALIAGFGLIFGPQQGRADDMKAPSAAEQQKALAKIPEKLRAKYDHYWTFSPIFDNPYANWTPPKPPWQICYNDSNLAQSWRSDLYSELQKINSQYHKAGLTKEKVLVTDSNFNINLQLTQFNNLVQQGCNIIVSIPGTPAGLCSGMEDAVKKGVLVVTVQSAVSCNAAINVGSNQYTTYERLGEWVIKEMGEKGNLLFIAGVPGISTTVSDLAGLKAKVAEYPNVKLVDVIYGFWSPAPAKSKVVQWLATHPTKIDGIVSAGGMATAIDEALLQSGRKLVPHANGTNECPYIAYWKEKKLHSFAMSAGGGSNGYEAIYVALRMMFGQKPVANTLWFDLPAIDDAEAAKLYRADMTTTSTCWADPPDHRLVPDEYFDAFFEGGKPLSPAPNP